MVWMFIFCFWDYYEDLAGIWQLIIMTGLYGVGILLISTNITPCIIGGISWLVFITISRGLHFLYHRHD